MEEANEKQRFYIAVKGVVLHEGKALTVRRCGILTPDGRDWWEFPGGTLEFGETPQQTLVREMREETGLCVTPAQLLSVSSVQMHPDYQIIVITYFCQCGNVSKVRISEEHSGYMWADEQTLRKILADDITTALDENGVWKELKGLGLE